jgi:hypothetical protein
VQDAKVATAVAASGHNVHTVVQAKPAGNIATESNALWNAKVIFVGVCAREHNVQTLVQVKFVG